MYEPKTSFYTVLKANSLVPCTVGSLGAKGVFISNFIYKNSFIMFIPVGETYKPIRKFYNMPPMESSPESRHLVGELE